MNEQMRSIQHFVDSEIDSNLDNESLRAAIHKAFHMVYYSDPLEFQKKQIFKIISSKVHAPNVGSVEADYRKWAEEEEKRTWAEKELPMPEPYPEKVNGDKLLNDIMLIFSDYISLQDTRLFDLVAVFVASTYFAEHTQSKVSALGNPIYSFSNFPYLAWISPLPECGKTSALTLMANMVYRGQLIGKTTTPAIYRDLDKGNFTLLLDEMDTYFETDEHMANILNNGFTRGGVIKLCVEQEGKFKTATFKVASFKVFAKLKEFNSRHAALASRTLQIYLQRKGPNDRRKDYKETGIVEDETLKVIQSKLMRIAKDIPFLDPVPVPDKIHNRQRDIARVLLTVANAIGGKNWVDRTLEGLSAINTQRGVESETSLLEKAMRDMILCFHDSGKNRVSTDDMILYLNSKEDSNWNSFCHGKPIDVQALNRLLRIVEVSSKQMRLPQSHTVGIFGEKTTIDKLRGYDYNQCRKAFEPYIPDVFKEGNIRNSEGELAKVESILQPLVTPTVS